MGIGGIMAIEGGRGIDRHNWSDSYWESRKTSTGFSKMPGLTLRTLRGHRSPTVVVARA